MYYVLKKTGIVFWIIALFCLIFSIKLLVRDELFLAPVAAYILIAIPTIFAGIALTLTLVSKALEEQSISAINLISGHSPKEK